MEKNKAKITSKVEELERRLELGAWIGGNEDDTQECGCGGDPGITIEVEPTEPTDSGDGKGNN